MKAFARLVIAVIALMICIDPTTGVQARDYIYKITNGTVMITQYIGSGGNVSVPDMILNVPVTSIGGAAFNGCTSLTNLTIPNSVTSIEGVCYGCSNLQSVAIGNNVTNIGAQAFQGCASLTNVTIPAGVTSIGAWAFGGCTSLTNLTIPNKVTSIGSGVFAGCISLGAINVDPVNERYRSLDGILFDEDKTTLIQCPAGKSESYTIPNTVTTVMPWAFLACSNLTTITMGINVRSIELAAFSECGGLTSIIIPNSLTNIGTAAFFDCTALKTMYFLGNAPSVDPTALSGDNYLTTYYLPGATGWGTRLPIALPYFGTRRSKQRGLALEF